MYYGQVKCCSVLAIVLSDVRSLCLAGLEGAVLDSESLHPLLHLAFNALAGLHISHNNIKLDNFHLVGKKVMVVDFEHVVTELSDADFEWATQNSVCRLIGYYRENVNCFMSDGLLPKGSLEG